MPFQGEQAPALFREELHGVPVPLSAVRAGEQLPHERGSCCRRMRPRDSEEVTCKEVASELEELLRPGTRDRGRSEAPESEKAEG